jgi:hypothetical protein
MQAAAERYALWQLCHELLDELQQPAAAPPPPPLQPWRLADAAEAGAPRDAKHAELVGPEAAPRARAAGQRQLEPPPPELPPQPPQLLHKSPQGKQPPPPQQQQQEDQQEQQHVQDSDVRAAQAARDARGLASSHAASGRLELLIEVDALRSSGAAAEALRSARLTVTLTSGAIAPPLVVLSRTCDASRVCDSGASATAGSLSPGGSLQGSTWSLAVARKLQVSRQQLRALELLVVHIHAPERDAWFAMGAVDLAGLGLATARTSARAELLCALRSADGRWHAELVLVLSVAPARPPTEPSAAASRMLPRERLVGADSWTRFQEIIEAIISEED